MNCDDPGCFPGSGGPLAAALAALDAAVDVVADTDAVGLPGTDLLDAVVHVERVARRLDAVTLRLVSAVASSGAAEATGAASPAAWLRGVLSLRPGQARRQVRLAGALLRWPATRTALERGEVNAEQAEVIATTLTALPADVDPSMLAEAEAFLLEQAGMHDAAALARLGVHLRHVVDPAGVEAALARTEARAEAARELHLIEDESGGGLVRGRLDAVGLATLRTALDPLAAPRPATAEGPDARSAAQRRADALVALACGVLDGGGLPTQGGVRPHLTVTVPLATLRAELGQRAATTGALAAELDWAGPISAATARRLACDARILPVVLGGASQPLDVGRATYTVPAGIRAALVARDRGCAFPGCDRPPTWTQAHHIQHWARGGRTALDNLVLLCDSDHDLVHVGGWTVRIGADGLPQFTPPPGTNPTHVPDRRSWTARLQELARGPDARCGDDSDPPPDEAAA